MRLTLYLDLVIDLEPDAARDTMRALTSIGLQPRVPVNPLDFADPQKREEWIRTKNMMVFSMLDPRELTHTVDLFVDPPIPFQDLLERSIEVRVGQVPVRIAAIDDLIVMKELAGRTKDLLDIDKLRQLRHEK